MNKPQSAAMGTLALVMALAAGHATAQPPGPDVIVGELPNTTNWGATGGVRAYSVGTTSCNIGDTALLWIASNNQHPVIGQNMYRLSNDRFEQIGQSWLKHGFTALQGQVCNNCPVPNPDGTALA